MVTLGPFVATAVVSRCCACHSRAWLCPSCARCAWHSSLYSKDGKENIVWIVRVVRALWNSPRALPPPDTPQITLAAARQLFSRAATGAGESQDQWLWCCSLKRFPALNSLWVVTQLLHALPQSRVHLWGDAHTINMVWGINVGRGT